MGIQSPSLTSCILSNGVAGTTRNPRRGRWSSHMYTGSFLQEYPVKSPVLSCCTTQFNNACDHSGAINLNTQPR